MAVVGGEGADLEEVTRSRPHLGVVGHEEEVRLGAVENVGHRAGHPGRMLQPGANVGEVAHERVVLRGQWRDERIGRARCRCRPRARSVSAASAASLRNSTTRSDPLLWGTATRRGPGRWRRRRCWATRPDADDRSCTERSCLPITGTMSSGARSGECKSPSAELNCLTAACSGAVAERSTTSDAVRCDLAWVTSAIP